MPLFDAYTINNTGLVNAIVQNVVSVASNSSTGALAPTTAAASGFTGAAASTLGVAGIQVSLFTNQNCTVKIQQSPDGSNWDISDSYSYRYQTTPNFGLTTQAVSSYFRTIVENNSTTSSATPFRLQTCLCPIVEPLPRTLDEEGYLSVCLRDIEDSYGSHIKLSPIGGLNTTKLTRLVGTSFNGTTVDSNFWQVSAVAGASATQVGGELTLITNAATTGAACYLQSYRSARYIPANQHYARFIMDCGSTTGAGTTKRWGVWTSSAIGAYNSPQDGAAFSIINGALSVSTFNAGSATVVSNGSFNGEAGTTRNLPPLGTNTYEIMYSNSKVWFTFNGEQIHIVNATSAPWTSTTTLPIRVECYNASATAFNTSIKVRSASIHRFGDLEAAPIYWAPTAAVTGAILKRGAGRLIRVLDFTNIAGTLTLYDGVTTAAPSTTIAAVDLQRALGTTEFGIDFYQGLCATSTLSTVLVVYE